MQWLPGDFFIFVYYVNVLCILNYVNKRARSRAVRDAPPGFLSKYGVFSICNRKILLFPAGWPPQAGVYTLYNYILYKLSAHTGCQGL